MSIDAARPERMNPHEVRQRLEHERNSRLSQLQAIPHVDHGPDSHMVSAQKEAIARVLKEVDAAFARLEAGTYGICQECSRPIPVERLEILSYARCCVACQRRTA